VKRLAIFPAGSATKRQRGFASSLLVVAMLFLATLAVIAWVGMGIVNSERWPIRWLEINGAFQRVSAEQLRANLSSEVGSSFFTVDMGAVRDSAIRIPWVSAVQVQKQWPDTIRVSVEEYVPVAHWNNGQLVASSGRLFEVPEADEIQGLPWLEGPDARLQEVLQTWVGLDELLVPLGLEIVHMSLDGRGAWSLRLDNGTHIQLGRDSTVERLERLLASWESLMVKREAPPLDVDLRYTNGFAVAWSAAAGPETPDKM
jgi:cell division protein FtsQ